MKSHQRLGGGEGRVKVFPRLLEVEGEGCSGRRVAWGCCPVPFKAGERRAERWRGRMRVRDGASRTSLLSRRWEAPVGEDGCRHVGKGEGAVLRVLQEVKDRAQRTHPVAKESNWGPDHSKHQKPVSISCSC